VRLAGLARKDASHYVPAARNPRLTGDRCKLLTETGIFELA